MSPVIRFLLVVFFGLLVLVVSIHFAWYATVWGAVLIGVLSATVAESGMYALKQTPVSFQKATGLILLLLATFFAGFMGYTALAQPPRGWEWIYFVLVMALFITGWILLMNFVRKLFTDRSEHPET